MKGFELIIAKLLTILPILVAVVFFIMISTISKNIAGIKVILA